MTRHHRKMRRRRSRSLQQLQHPSPRHNPQCRKVPPILAAASVVVSGCTVWFILYPNICVCYGLCQLLQQCLLLHPFLCLPRRLLCRRTSQQRLKRSWKLRGELGKRLRGPANRARREIQDSRQPRANQKLRPVICSQVLLLHLTFARSGLSFG